MDALEPLVTPLKNGSPLSPDEVGIAANALLDEAVGVESKVEFLAALAGKRETPGEIAGFADVFLNHAVDPGVDADAVGKPLLDVCGTGGDKLDLFNVSTTSMFVVAAGGVAVVKHGNRGITSKSGGADVLEASGVRIDLPAESFADCLAACGVGFMLAPQYHPAFKAVVPVRKILAERGQRTVFNLIGPLLNPVRPANQMLGVFDPLLAPVFAEILQKLGRESAWVVCGETGDDRVMDELSTLAPNTVVRLEEGGAIVRERVDPRDLGFSPADLDGLKGGDPVENAALLRAILDGSESGPRRDLVVLNAAAGLTVAGVVESLQDGVVRASALIDSGAALDVLEALRGFGGSS